MLSCLIDLSVEFPLLGYGSVCLCVTVPAHRYYVSKKWYFQNLLLVLVCWEYQNDGFYQHRDLMPCFDHYLHVNVDYFFKFIVKCSDIKCLKNAIVCKINTLIFVISNILLIIK